MYFGLCCYLQYNIMVTKNQEDIEIFFIEIAVSKGYPHICNFFNISYFYKIK